MRFMCRGPSAEDGKFRVCRLSRMKPTKSDIFPELAAPEAVRAVAFPALRRVAATRRVGPDKLVILTAFASGMLAVLLLL